MNTSNNNGIKQVVVFSGLGADERVFYKLNFEGCPVTYIKWVKPIHNEPIDAYAKRLLKQINCPTPPVLLGLSFGGLMAAEVAKLIPYEKIILISSVKTVFEMPAIYRWVGKLKLTNFLPVWFLKHNNVLSYYLFGIKTPDEKKLLNTILAETDAEFLKWAIHQLVNWKSIEEPICTYHIHGSNDKLFPIKQIKQCTVINNGGHFMIVNKAEEINRFVKEHCKN